MTLPAAVRAWSDGGAKVALGAHGMFVREQPGPGPRVLLLHGFPSSSFDWRAVFAALPDRWLTAPDFLGFGLSDKPRSHTYSLLEQADLVQALVALDAGDGEGPAEPLILVAHDMGTSVACELLARDLEGRLGFRLAAVLLLNGSMVLEKAKLTRGQRLLRGPLGALGAALSHRRGFEREFAALFSPAHPLQAEEADAQWALLARAGGNRLLHRLIHYLEERITLAARWHGALRDWPGRLELAWAGRDPVCVEAVLQAILELRPHAPLTRLPELGHYPQIEDPPRIAALIEALAATS